MHNFSIELIIGKLEDDGNEIATFRLLDILEIVSYDNLKSKLDEFHDMRLKKITELKKMLERKK